MNPPIEAFLFDLDGTLVDTWEDLAISLNHALSRLDRPFRSGEEVRSFIGDGVRVLVARGLGKAATDPLVEKGAAYFREHYFAHCAEHARLFPGRKRWKNSRTALWRSSRTNRSPRRRRF
jgi:phosphoglycolate phosphatase